MDRPVNPDERDPSVTAVVAFSLVDGLTCTHWPRPPRHLVPSPRSSEQTRSGRDDGTWAGEPVGRGWERHRRKTGTIVATGLERGPVVVGKPAGRVPRSGTATARLTG
jgi:hypothetical protein